ncbi:MAG: carboxypeptidase regulatory-like domain-containing protein, partial [Candidatus Aenigmatarchaeota archaeon]
MNRKFPPRRMKSTLGQSEILVAALFIVLISGAVIAQNATNMTNFTGNLIFDPASFENITNESTQQTIEISKAIEIYANSQIVVGVDKQVLYKNETVSMLTTLSMDNGTFLENRVVEFYLNDFLMGSSLTDYQGIAIFEYDISGEEVGESALRTMFHGTSYINPSSSEHIVTIKPSEDIEITEMVMHADQQIDNNGMVTITGNVYPTGIDYNVSIVVIDAYSEEVYRNIVQSTGEFEVSFRLPRGGYQTFMTAFSEYGKTNYIIDTIVRNSQFASGIQTFSQNQASQVNSPITYDPTTDTIYVVAIGSMCTEQNPCSIADIYNEDAINGWGRVERFNNYFVTMANIVIGDGTTETYMVSTLQHLDIRKPWKVSDKGSFQLGDFTDGVVRHGGQIFSKIPPGQEGKSNSAFYVENGGKVKLYDATFKVLEDVAENNFIVEDGASFEANRFEISRRTNFNKTNFTHPDGSRIENFAKNEFVTKEGDSVSITNLLIINQNELPFEGENWTVRFLTRGTDDLQIDYDENSVQDLEFFGLYCGEQRIDTELQGTSIYVRSWRCGEEARIINNVKVQDYHTLLFSFRGEETIAHNSDKSGCITWSNNAYIRVDANATDSGACCTKAAPCTMQDICDTIGGRCAQTPSADLYNPEDTNVWMFLVLFQIATQTNNDTWWVTENEVINIGGPSDMTPSMRVSEGGNARFGNLTPSGPQQGSTTQTYVTSQICDQSAMCFRDFLYGNCSDNGTAGGKGYFYASNYISFRVNNQRNNIDAGSPSTGITGSCAGLGTQHIDINRFTMQTSVPKTGDESNSIILYVPANTTLYDLASYNARYAMEMSGEPDEPLEVIRFQDARAGIRICYAAGSVKGYEGINNVDDIRMGGYHYLIAINSEINESKIDYSSCGSGSANASNDYSYIIRKSTLNIDFKNATDDYLEDLTAAARILQGRIVFNKSTYANGTIDEQTLDFKKIHVLSAVEANQDKADYTPHELYYRKYGYKYIKTSISMSNPITTSAVLYNNPCTVLNESNAAGQTGITYNTPTQYEFEDWTDSGDVGADDEIQLSGVPITQSEHFQILNIEGISAVRLVPMSVVSKSDYTINYDNGTIFFVDGYETTNVTPVYFYSGNITISEDKNTSQVYDYMQALQVNYTKGEEYLTDVLTTTDDCATYTSYVYLILNGSAINNTETEKKINTEDGYGFSATSYNGTTINIISDVWNFTWFSDNGTFFRKYTINVRVQNASGDPIENATVQLNDTYSNTIFEINTSSSGTIPRQEVTHTQYNYTGNRTYSPFTITVSKTVYTTTSQPVDLDRKTELTITLSAPCDPNLNYTFDVISGNNTITNRSTTAGNLTMRVRVKYGNGTVVGAGHNVTLYITKVGSGAGATWDSGRVLTTNASGEVNYSFFPTCDNLSTPLEDEEYEVGDHDWYTIITTTQDPDLCQDEQSDTWNFSVIGTLSNTIDLPDGSENYTAADTILIQGAVENYCEEPITLNTTTEINYNLSTTGYVTNCTPVETLGANVYKCNWNPDQTTSAGYYNVTMWSNYTNYYENTTIAENIFYLTTSPSMTEANVTPRQDAWNILHNFSIRVADNLGDVVNVTLQEQILGQSWYDVEWQNCTNCSDNGLGYTTLNFSKLYSCSGYAGNWMKFRFRANDTEGNLIYTDSFPQYYGQDDTFELQKADTNVTYISGNNSIATPTTPAIFVVRVYDLDNTTKNFSTGEYPLVKFYVENSSGGMQFVNQSYTNETGYANVSFYVSLDFSGGNKTWYAKVDTDDTCYQYNITENLTVDIQVNWPPLYKNMLARDKSSGVQAGWGENWNFSVQVKDSTAEFDDVNVTLQIDTGSGWTNIETKNCTECSTWSYVNFTLINFTCNDINDSAYYRFNLTDNNSNYNTSISKVIDIEQDEVTFKIIWGGYGNVSNRS